MPTGRVVLADSSDAEITSDEFVGARRCRVFVAVHGRDLSTVAAWGLKTDAHHLILVWPSRQPEPRWRSAHRDKTAGYQLDGYTNAGIDPEVGQREA